LSKLFPSSSSFFLKIIIIYYLFVFLCSFVEIIREIERLKHENDKLKNSSSPDVYEGSNFVSYLFFFFLI
jgi:hypothetical protein